MGVVSAPNPPRPPPPPPPPPRPPRPCAAAAAVASLCLRAERRAGTACERDALAVRRPRRAAVEVHTWGDEVDRAGLHVVHPDEAVIPAIAHERDLGAIGRPARLALRAPLLDERLLRQVHRVGRRLRHARAIDLAFTHVEERLGVRRDDWRIALRQAPGPG